MGEDTLLVIAVELTRRACSHRASRIDTATRVRRLQAFVDPVKAQWKNEGLKRALSTYGGFCELIGLDKAQDYLVRRRIHEIKDWGAVDLDPEGQALQAELEERQAVGAPAFSFLILPPPLSPLLAKLECLRLTYRAGSGFP